MNTLISATDAHRESLIANKTILSKEQRAKNKLEKKMKLESERKKSEFKTSITKEVYDGINRAIRSGITNTKIILKNNWSRHLSNKSFEFDGVINELVTEIKSKGYEVHYGPEDTYHDTSFDYMNSGGECGSSTPYYTTELKLCINWDNR